MGLSLLMLAMTLTLGVIYLAIRPESPPAEKPRETVSAQRTEMKPGRTIEFGNTEQEEDAESMDQRKKRYGILDSVDMIVTSDESVRVGGETLVMRDFEEKDALSRGGIVTLPLEDGNIKTPSKSYGIHVVRPKDNIWTIHFRILREYLASRGILLPLSADQPDPEGHSSGVGKVLKFSERMVRIYNMKEKQFAENIHIIHPFEKIIIYNLEEMRELLDTLTQENVDRIRFDGENLWISAE